jgi:glutathione S-transferase
LPAERQDEFASKQAGGHKALAIMDAQLRRMLYLAGEGLTIADISLYAYTPVEADGGFDLAEYVNILAWIARIEALPNYLPMQNNISD